jgi:hypothetical protein
MASQGGGPSQGEGEPSPAVLARQALDSELRVILNVGGVKYVPVEASSDSPEGS